MRRTKIASGAAVAALAVAVAAAPAGGAERYVLKATMSGAKETPTRGDTDGRGRATIRITGRTVCYQVSFTKIGRGLAAHIHRGASGRAGDIVVPLWSKPASKNSRRGCVRNVDRDLAEEIGDHPGRFYVNVHTTAFGGGAIRGQLHR